jgi:hypothetical protein
VRIDSFGIQAVHPRRDGERRDIVAAEPDVCMRDRAVHGRHGKHDERLAIGGAERIEPRGLEALFRYAPGKHEVIARAGETDIEQARALLVLALRHLASLR